MNVMHQGSLHSVRKLPLCVSVPQCLHFHRPSSVSKSFVSRAFIDAEHASNVLSSAHTFATEHLQILSTLAEDQPSASTEDNGPVGLLANFLETCLKVLDEGLDHAGVPYSYGYAIIILTFFVKLATFPLSQKQVQSSVAVQALQPRVREIQARFANEPEQIQLETARLYRDAGVNPLAGCLPSLATIPIFIGLYKALTQAADDGLMSQGFYWIPSLAGPVSLASRNEGSGLTWLFPFTDGSPPIGWHDAILYLILPLLLVVSQFVSQAIISPAKSDDPATQQTQAILKFLPLMIGWFSLNVPSGLTLYWFVNNILSTVQQVYLKRSTTVNVPTTPLEPVAQMPIVKPKEEQVKRPGGKDLGSRRKRRESEDDGGPVTDVEVNSSEVVTPRAEASNGAGSASGKGGGSRGNKFRALKAREAAMKAASVAGEPDSEEARKETPSQ